MINNYYKFIKELRLKKNLSQAEVAEKIGISRASYISFEKNGGAELSYDEAVKLTDLLGITMEEMKMGLKPNYDKYKQMIMAFLRNDLGVGGFVTKTKLAKLVYLADFAWFYNHLDSMSGMSYRKIKYGPVPDSYFRAIDEMYEEGLINIDNKSKEGAFLISLTRAGLRNDLNDINKEERDLIKNISDKWRSAQTQDIVKFTHEQLPYEVCGDNEIIPYGLITQEDPDYVY